MLERAVGLDPNYAIAIAFAAWAAEKLHGFGYFDDPATPGHLRRAARGARLARMALDRGRDDPLVQVIAGWVMLAVDLDPLGIEIVRRGLAANPNNLVALNLGGNTNLIAAGLRSSVRLLRARLPVKPGRPRHLLEPHRDGLGRARTRQ